MTNDKLQLTNQQQNDIIGKHGGFLEDICRLFEKEEIPYGVTGGFAASIWGIPRATSDVDIVLNISGEKREKIVSLQTY